VTQNCKIHKSSCYTPRNPVEPLSLTTFADRNEQCAGNHSSVLIINPIIDKRGTAWYFCDEYMFPFFSHNGVTGHFPNKTLKLQLQPETKLGN